MGWRKRWLSCHCAWCGRLLRERWSGYSCHRRSRNRRSRSRRRWPCLGSVQSGAPGGAPCGGGCLPPTDRPAVLEDSPEAPLQVRPTAPWVRRGPVGHAQVLARRPEAARAVERQRHRGRWCAQPGQGRAPPRVLEWPLGRRPWPPALRFEHLHRSRATGGRCDAAAAGLVVSQFGGGGVRQRRRRQRRRRRRQRRCRRERPLPRLRRDEVRQALFRAVAAAGAHCRRAGLALPRRGRGGAVARERAREAKRRSCFCCSSSGGGGGGGRGPLRAVDAGEHAAEEVKQREREGAGPERVPRRVQAGGSGGIHGSSTDGGHTSGCNSGGGGDDTGGRSWWRSPGSGGGGGGS